MPRLCSVTFVALGYGFGCRTVLPQVSGTGLVCRTAFMEIPGTGNTLENTSGMFFVHSVPGTEHDFRVYFQPVMVSSTHNMHKFQHCSWFLRECILQHDKALGNFAIADTRYYCCTRAVVDTMNSTTAWYQLAINEGKNLPGTHYE